MNHTGFFHKQQLLPNLCMFCIILYMTARVILAASGSNEVSAAQLLQAKHEGIVAWLISRPNPIRVSLEQDKPNLQSENHMPSKYRNSLSLQPQGRPRRLLSSRTSEVTLSVSGSGKSTSTNETNFYGGNLSPPPIASPSSSSYSSSSPYPPCTPYLEPSSSAKRPPAPPSAVTPPPRKRRSPPRPSRSPSSSSNRSSSDSVGSGDSSSPPSPDIKGTAPSSTPSASSNEQPPTGNPAQNAPSDEDHPCAANPPAPTPEQHENSQLQIAASPPVSGSTSPPPLSPLSSPTYIPTNNSQLPLAPAPATAEELPFLQKSKGESGISTQDLVVGISGTAVGAVIITTCVAVAIAWNLAKCSGPDKTCNRAGDKEEIVCAPEVGERADHQRPPKPLGRPNAGVLCGRKGASQRQHSASSISGTEEDALGDVRLLNSNKLCLATDNFSKHQLLGEGGSGMVYCASFKDGTKAAVKKLSWHKNLGISSKRAVEQFKMEVKLMSTLSHQNLVRMLGESFDDNNHLLVYELMPNGSLHDHLHAGSGSTRTELTWLMRMQIALDSASALEYLHESCSPPVIHRDFKSSNILLDAEFRAKVSDFGLAKLVQDGGMHAGTTCVLGTFGYVSPEYVMTGQLTEKTDVYSFGVVMLELITGRKPVDSSLPPREQSLVAWASPQLMESESLLKILDRRLQGDQINLKHLQKAAAIAALCVQPEAEHRPKMKYVCKVLSSLIPSGSSGGGENEAGKRISMDISETISTSYFPSPSQNRDAHLYDKFWKQIDLESQVGNMT